MLFVIPFIIMAINEPLMNSSIFCWVYFTAFLSFMQLKFDEITNIENMDFEDCIAMYDSKDTFHYIDAPYYECEKYYSNHDFGLESHERLAKCLHKIEGKFAMSYYYFDKLEEWFPKDGDKITVVNTSDNDGVYTIKDKKANFDIKHIDKKN